MQLPTVNKFMKPALLLFIILSLSSCTPTLKTLDFGSFTIQVPEEWKPIEVQGVDSYVGKIAIDNKDTLSFDLGYYSNSLEEEERVFITKSNAKHFSKEMLEYPSVVIIEDKDTLIDREDFKKNTTNYEKVGDYHAKIVRPKKAGEGTTGLYIDSIRRVGDNIVKFQISGSNLSPANVSLALDAFRTIRFTSIRQF